MEGAGSTAEGTEGMSSPEPPTPLWLKVAVCLATAGLIVGIYVLAQLVSLLIS